MLRLYLVKFLAFYLGCFCCHFLQVAGGLSAVTAAAALGFAVTFIPLPSTFNPKGVHAAFYAGTFAGMCSSEIIVSHPHILIVSLIGAGIYVAMKPYFTGLGGKLGAVAFISSLLLILAKAIL